MVNKRCFSRTELLDVAVDSVKRCGTFALFWKYLHDARRAGRVAITLSEARDFEAANSDYVYRCARGADLSVQSNCESGCFFSRMIDIDVLDEVKSIDIAPLVKEIPSYLELLRPKPERVLLIEAVYAVRDVMTLQPLFKVVGDYRVRRGVHNGGRQLFIVGRDRHTNEPFALGVPNGFVRFPIDVALRWTMNVHKGDIVEEV